MRVKVFGSGAERSLKTTGNSILLERNVFYSINRVRTNTYKQHQLQRSLTEHTPGLRKVCQ